MAGQPESRLVIPSSSSSPSSTHSCSPSPTLTFEDRPLTEAPDVIDSTGQGHVRDELCQQVSRIPGTHRSEDKEQRLENTCKQMTGAPRDGTLTVDTLGTALSGNLHSLLLLS
jgi:hypothetical protein